MTQNELLLHDFTQRYYSTNDPLIQKSLLAKMKTLSDKITEDKLPKTGWWLVNPNPGPLKGIPEGSIYLGTSLTLKANRHVNDEELTTPSNHSAVIYWGTK